MPLLLFCYPPNLLFLRVREKSKSSFFFFFKFILPLFCCTTRVYSFLFLLLLRRILAPTTDYARVFHPKYRGECADDRGEPVEIAQVVTQRTRHRCVRACVREVLVSEGGSSLKKKMKKEEEKKNAPIFFNGGKKKNG